MDLVSSIRFDNELGDEWRACYDGQRKRKDISRADLMEVGSRAGLPSRVVRSATEEVEESVREVLREIG